MYQNSQRPTAYWLIMAKNQIKDKIFDHKFQSLTNEHGHAKQKEKNSQLWLARTYIKRIAMATVTSRIFPKPYYH